MVVADGVRIQVSLFYMSSMIGNDSISLMLRERPSLYRHLWTSKAPLVISSRHIFGVLFQFSFDKSLLSIKYIAMSQYFSLLEKRLTGLLFSNPFLLFEIAYLYEIWKGWTYWIDICPSNGNLLAAGNEAHKALIFDKRESKIIKTFDSIHLSKKFIFINW